MIELTFLKVLMLIRQVHQKKYNICHYWYFLDKWFKFQPDACNEFHDVLMMSINLNDIAILSIHGVDYHCIIHGISKSEAMGLLRNANLNEKSGTLSKIIFLYRV